MSLNIYRVTDRNKTLKEYQRRSGAKGGRRTRSRRGKSFFSKIAKLSHPRTK